MKPHIKYNVEYEAYECWCSLRIDPIFLNSAGIGATPKEAYLDWYCQRLGYLVDQVCYADVDYSSWEPL